MEINYFLDKFIIDWLKNIEEVTYFEYIKGPNSYYIDIEKGKEPILTVIIKDNKGNHFTLLIFPEDVAGPLIYFDKPDEYRCIQYQGDVSVCEELLKIIQERHLIR